MLPSSVVVLSITGVNNIQFNSKDNNIQSVWPPFASCHRSAPSESEAATAVLLLRPAAGSSSFSTSTLSQLTKRLEADGVPTSSLWSTSQPPGLETAELKTIFLQGVDSDEDRSSGRSRLLPRNEDGFLGDMGGGLRKTAAVLCELADEWRPRGQTGWSMPAAAADVGGGVAKRLSKASTGSDTSWSVMMTSVFTATAEASAADGRPPPSPGPLGADQAGPSGLAPPPPRRRGQSPRWPPPGR